MNARIAGEHKLRPRIVWDETSVIFSNRTYQTRCGDACHPEIVHKSVELWASPQVALDDEGGSLTDMSASQKVEKDDFVFREA